MQKSSDSLNRHLEGGGRCHLVEKTKISFSNLTRPQPIWDACKIFADVHRPIYPSLLTSFIFFLFLQDVMFIYRRNLRDFFEKVKFNSV